jgi:hypothetical protein
MSKRKPARTIKARSASKVRSKAAGSGQPKERANSKQARVLALLCGPSGARRSGNYSGRAAATVVNHQQQMRYCDFISSLGRQAARMEN